MAGLTTVIFANGIVQSTYDDGTPADIFSGKLPILKKIFHHLEYKDLLPTSYRIGSIKFYISNDPLCKSIMEVSHKNLYHVLQFINNTGLDEFENTDVSKIINDTNNLPENINFDNNG